ncbi:MAG: dephospho-CoA kinase [Clostridia bacterium]|nr:dephospho-CoA kinase [Clostridia bacterium]
MMNKRIAITGGIGSGKSIVGEYLKKKGFTVFSCDKIYAELITTENYIQAIKQAFPTAVADGRVDKSVLSNIIFSDITEREKLNQIAHPLIMQSLDEQMRACEGVVFAEVPLLFEGGFEGLFDEIIVIKRNLTDRIVAICQRDGLQEDKARLRIQSQFDYDSRAFIERTKDLSVYILNNDAPLETLFKRIDAYVANIK